MLSQYLDHTTKNPQTNEVLSIMNPNSHRTQISVAHKTSDLVSKRLFIKGYQSKQDEDTTDNF